MFGRKTDPTADWPATGERPVLDLATQSIGSLQLGGTFEDARALGRPAKVHGKVQDGNFVLEHASFELEYHHGQLACVKFDLDGPASVELTGDIRLSRATRPLDTHVWFGEPASDSTDGKDRRWIDFERGGATLALEFQANELTCVQLYAEGYA